MWSWIEALWLWISPLLSREYLRTKLEYESVAVLTPFVLRAGGTSLVWFGLDKLFGGNVQSALTGGLGRDRKVCKANIILSRYRYDSPYQSWSLTRERLQLDTNRLALIVAGSRVVGWHLLQPLTYYVVFYAFSDLMDAAELVLSAVVGAREAVYIAATFSCCIWIPGIFLYSTKEQGLAQNLMYVVMPEKLLILTLIHAARGRGHHGYCALLVGVDFFIIPLFDLCGIAAIILFLVRGHCYAPLMIGYGVTALSGIIVLTFYIFFCLTLALEELCDCLGCKWLPQWIGRLLSEARGDEEPDTDRLREARTRLVDLEENLLNATETILKLEEQVSSLPEGLAPQQVARCPKGHRLADLGVTEDGGWRCQGAEPGGCKSGITPVVQTKGLNRRGCSACDFDLCPACWNDAPKEPYETFKVLEQDAKDRKQMLTEMYQLAKERRRALEDAVRGASNSSGQSIEMQGREVASSPASSSQAATAMLSPEEA